MTWSVLTHRLGILVSETHGLIGETVAAGIRLVLNFVGLHFSQRRTQPRAQA